MAPRPPPPDISEIGPSHQEDDDEASGRYRFSLPPRTRKTASQPPEEAPAAQTAQAAQAPPATPVPPQPPGPREPAALRLQETSGSVHREVGGGMEEVVQLSQTPALHPSTLETSTEKPEKSRAVVSSDPEDSWDALPTEARTPEAEALEALTFLAPQTLIHVDVGEREDLGDLFGGAEEEPAEPPPANPEAPSWPMEAPPARPRSERPPATLPGVTAYAQEFDVVETMDAPSHPPPRPSVPPRPTLEYAAVEGSGFDLDLEERQHSPARPVAKLEEEDPLGLPLEPLEEPSRGAPTVIGFARPPHRAAPADFETLFDTDPPRGPAEPEDEDGARERAMDTATTTQFRVEEPDRVEEPEATEEPAEDFVAEAEADAAEAAEEEGARALEEQAQRDALADFTRSLVQTMNRSTYYEVGHPAHASVSEELFEKLLGLLREQPQVGYLLLRGKVPEVFVDGVGSNRVNLRETMAAGVYEVFIPRFIEYFDRYELVMLAFGRAMTLSEFGHFVSVITRPATHHASVSLSESLLAAGVMNVSCLSAADLGSVDADLPWQVRVCLARLRRDLRAIPYYQKLGEDAVRAAKKQIFLDVVRPLQHVDLIKLLVINAPRIEDDLARHHGLVGLHITESVVAAVSVRALCELLESLLGDLAGEHRHADVYGPAREEALGLCRARLLLEKPPGTEATFRALYERKMVALSELPDSLQEYLLAEEWLSRREAGATGRFVVTDARDARVLARIVRKVLDAGEVPAATDLAEPLVSVAEDAHSPLQGVSREVLAKLIPPEELDGLILRFESVHGEEQQGLGRFLGSLGRLSAVALMRRLLTQEGGRLYGPSWQLLDGMRAHTGDAVRWALDHSGDAPPTALRAIMTMARRHLDPQVAESAARFAHHDDGRVRLAALGLLAEARHPFARELFLQRVEDDDADVRTMVLSALHDRLDEPDEARRHALKVLLSARQDTPRELLLVCIRVVASADPEGPDRDQVVAALVHAQRKETLGGGIFGLRRGTVHEPEVVEAARVAQEHFGAEHSSGRSSWIDRLLKR
ncbi:MAG: hypothetical protein HY909_23525 [Deltaproteobacteria bacterium]|nr:hypothetical protein [Deltaproteobacteria bacterium]